MLLWQYQPGKFDPREGFTHHGLGQDIHYPVRLAGWLLLTWVYLVSRFKDSILRESSQPSTKRGGKKSADTFTDWRMVPLLLDVGRRSTVLLCPASFCSPLPTLFTRWLSSHQQSLTSRLTQAGVVFEKKKNSLQAYTCCIPQMSVDISLSSPLATSLNQTGSGAEWCTYLIYDDRASSLWTYLSKLYLPRLKKSHTD